LKCLPVAGGNGTSLDANPDDVKFCQTVLPLLRKKLNSLQFSPQLLTLAKVVIDVLIIKTIVFTLFGNV
jgi:hypothetical protein